jgi:molybdenum cofactor synthesis domain-containing protein
VTRTPIRFADALAIVTGAVRPIDRVERVDLQDADGRVVSSDVVSPLDVPPFDRAAMDGFAVRAADTAGATAAAPVTLTCLGDAFTGVLSTTAVGPGECLAIATGAPMPPGADAVVIVEETSRSGRAVTVRAGVEPRQHVGPRAADIASGAIVIAAGTVLSPSRIGALAAIGRTAVDVFGRPVVAIASTGDEIAEPAGGALGPGRIFDINRHTVAAVVARHGGTPAPMGPVADSLETLIEALDRARNADIIVFSGGSSVGERDLFGAAVGALGEVTFHGIAVKPGKPTLFGRIGPALVFGMPGYPTSCLSNAYMLLVPVLRRLARLPPWTPRMIDAPLARRVRSAPGRHQFYTVRMVDGAAEPAFKASGDITSMAHADGYFEIEAGTDVIEAGTRVRVTLF